MPWSLRRFHKTGALHFITWSCCDRRPFLSRAESRDLLLRVLEQMRNRYRSGVVGFVAMPEHVHLLMSEPLMGSVSSVISAVKLGSHEEYCLKIPTSGKTGQKWGTHIRLTGSISG